jgi:hypothetical protein
VHQRDRLQHAGCTARRRKHIGCWRQPLHRVTVYRLRASCPGQGAT